MEPEISRIIKTNQYSNHLKNKQSLFPSSTLKTSTLQTTANNTNTIHPDTAATGHFITTEHPGEEIPHQPMEVICANNSTMKSIATKLLHLPHLPQWARLAHVFQEMKRSLLSISVLCDAGCHCTFQQDKVTIMKNNHPIIQGTRDNESTLWCIPTTISRAPSPDSNNVIINQVSSPSPIPPTMSDQNQYNTNNEVNLIQHQRNTNNSTINTTVPQGCIKSNNHAYGVYQSQTASELTDFQHTALCVPTVKHS